MTNTETIIGIIETSKTSKMKTTMVAFLYHQMENFSHDGATFRDNFFDICMEYDKQTK